jgi:hypothetical protein
MSSTDDLHQHDHRCYWDHLSCGWICAAGVPEPQSADAAEVPAAPAPVPGTDSAR